MCTNELSLWLLIIIWIVLKNIFHDKSYKELKYSYLNFISLTLLIFVCIFIYEVIFFIRSSEYHDISYYALLFYSIIGLLMPLKRMTIYIWAAIFYKIILAYVFFCTIYWTFYKKGYGIKYLYVNLFHCPQRPPLGDTYCRWCLHVNLFKRVKKC